MGDCSCKFACLLDISTEVVYILKVKFANLLDILSKLDYNKVSKILRKVVFGMTIVPVSDLRNYNKVLNQVSYGNEVALTKNGKAQYAIVEMEELERLRAERWLMSELRKSEIDIAAGRVTTLADARKEFGI